MQCQPCDSTCSTCSAGTDSDCITCAAEKPIKHGSTCVAVSPVGFYVVTGEPSVTDTCNPSCLTCSGGSATECTSCPTQAPYLHEGACLAVCPTSYYAASDGSSCESCSASCATCSGGSDSDCLTCPVATPHLEGGACVCKSGYLSTETSCTQINECETGEHDCYDADYCTDLAGSFSCACPPGFTGDGVTCTDVNECLDGTHQCSEYATCTNLVGAVETSGYECTCTTSGYGGDGFYCGDLDECTLEEATPTAQPHNCHINANCINSDGSFSCTCSTGYDGDGISSCVDIDECATQTDDCDKMPTPYPGVSTRATCTNTDGGYICECVAPYFTGDGVTCVAPAPSPPPPLPPPYAPYTTLHQYSCVSATGQRSARANFGLREPPAQISLASMLCDYVGTASVQ